MVMMPEYDDDGVQLPEYKSKLRDFVTNTNWSPVEAKSGMETERISPGSCARSASETLVCTRNI